MLTATAYEVGIRLNRILYALCSPQPKSVLIAKAAPDVTKQPRIVIVATNALTDYDVVNFDLTKCGGDFAGAVKGTDKKDREADGATATIDIYRTSVSENCQKVTEALPISSPPKQLPDEGPAAI